MIRINLLAVERGKAKAPTLDPTQLALIGSGLIVVLALGWVGWRYLSLSREAARLAATILTEQQEKTRLDALVKQVKQFQAQQALLKQRVDLVEKLKGEQTGPVHMLDEISQALPDRMWLLQVKQGANGEVAIDGNVPVQTRVSDFINKLEASGYFKRQMDIVSTQTGDAPPGLPASEPELTRFSIKGIFQTSGAPQPANAAAPSGTQAPRPAGRAGG